MVVNIHTHPYIQEKESLNAASLSARVAELERELGSFRRASRQSETDKKVIT